MLTADAPSPSGNVAPGLPEAGLLGPLTVWHDFRAADTIAFLELDLSTSSPLMTTIFHVFCGTTGSGSGSGSGFFAVLDHFQPDFRPPPACAAIVFSPPLNSSLWVTPAVSSWVSSSALCMTRRILPISLASVTNSACCGVTNSEIVFAVMASVPLASRL